MIRSKSDYLMYLETDRIALGRKHTMKEYLFDDVWKFQRRLRWCEYVVNTNSNWLLILFSRLMLRRISRALGFTIPINTFGPGLSIAHYGTIVVNGAARIGANCRIHVCVNIGTAAGSSAEAPVIGDNCYIGPGAKIYGPIQIGSNIAIAANAVVNKNFIEDNITIGGIPAKIISKKGSKGYLRIAKFE